MDSIDIIDPSYGSNVDGTGSLVSNQIKFKKESRQRIKAAANRFKNLTRENVEAQVERKFEDMNAADVAETKENIRENESQVQEEIIESINNVSREEFNDEFKQTIKEKSDHAKRLEARVQALEAKDVDAYVSTLKPIPLVRFKPLKIKPVNYNTTYENGKKFSTMVEVPVEENNNSFDSNSDITMDKFEPMLFENQEVDVKQVAEENGDNLAENINNAMEEQAVESSVTGFEPVSSEMVEVAAVPEDNINTEVVVEEQPVEENVVSEAESIPEKELTEEDIRSEIDKIMNQMEELNAKEAKDTKIIDNLEQMANKEETNVIEEPVEEVIDEVVVDENPFRGEAIIAPEREEEAIVPIKVEEEEKEEVVDEDLHYDYSNITEKDVENTNSIAILEQMKKAKEKKLQEKREAEEMAASEERALVVSRKEAASIRKKAEASEKAVQAKMEEFNRYIESYDADIEEANKRREKAASDRARADQEIAEYEASIASNENIEKELESMMSSEEESIIKRK